MEKATFAGGCFWCTEAIFKRLKGVSSVTPGYSGGEVENPTYEQVSSGNTNHAEAIQIEFDPQEIPFIKLLEIFFYTHNPTTLNQQGNDIGSQYRSAVFYENEKQRGETEKYIKDLDQKGIYQRPIVTEVSPLKSFYVAEDYHKNYFDKNREAPYCDVVISPKIHKLLEKYGDSVRVEYKI